MNIARSADEHNERIRKLVAEEIPLHVYVVTQVRVKSGADVHSARG
jgi:hypothetical protein